MGHKEHLCPEFPAAVLLQGKILAVYRTDPGIEYSQKEQHKHYIDHMCVKISQHKRIAGKFMDSFVVHVRIVSDISGGIREPVSCSLLTGEFLYQRQNLSVYHIMHISGNGYRNTRYSAGHSRQAALPSDPE